MVGKPSSPAVITPDPPPPAPERSDGETAALAEEQRKRFFQGKGRASTMLTGGAGTEGGSFASRFLGSAART